ncbi:hypothetical protein M0804_010038 [Polistes exclamans]|nr:hypothetical protein M0804_010038 [Polistes exclamans]
MINHSLDFVNMFNETTLNYCTPNVNHASKVHRVLLESIILTRQYLKRQFDKYLEIVQLKVYFQDNKYMDNYVVRCA